MSAALPTIESLHTKLAAAPGRIVELAAATLDGLDGLGRELRAVAHLAKEESMRRASALTDVIALDAGAAASPLFGVALAHKDLYMRRGWPCEAGSRVMAGHVAERTASVIKRFDRAGAVDCGRLATVEFALGTTGHNAIAGTPTNPWNTAYICGGSSSGSAAAVAAGLVPAALGSDTGGSIRLPAAACGLVGIKPTHGLVGRSGIVALSPTLDAAGPLTRTVRDGAIVLQAIAGFDGDDTGSVRHHLADLLAEIEAGLEGIRIGWPRDHFMAGTDADVVDGVAEVFRLAGRLGATTSEVPVPGLETANARNVLITAVDGAALHVRSILDRHVDYGEQTLDRLLVGSFVPAQAYREAVVARAVAARRVLAETFSQVDVVVTPMWPYALPTIAESDAGGSAGAAEMILRSGHNARPVNYLGFPAVTLPTGFDANGLPSSVQLIGAPFTEARLLRVARALEREIDFWSARPPRFAAPII